MVSDRINDCSSTPILTSLYLSNPTHPDSSVHKSMYLPVVRGPHLCIAYIKERRRVEWL